MEEVAIIGEVKGVVVREKLHASGLVSLLLARKQLWGHWLVCWM